MSAAQQLNWYPPEIPVRALDVVWCRWPLHDGGFKDRPALVRTVLSRDGHRAIEVAYGTSKVGKAYISSFYVANLTEMNHAGLFQATRFELDHTLKLPFAAELFPKRGDGAGPVIGRLTEHAIWQLEQLIKATAATRKG